MENNISVAAAKATFSECIRKVEAGNSVLPMTANDIYQISSNEYQFAS